MISNLKLYTSAKEAKGEMGLGRVEESLENGKRKIQGKRR